MIGPAMAVSQATADLDASQHNVATSGERVRRFCVLAAVHTVKWIELKPKIQSAVPVAWCMQVSKGLLHMRLIL